MADYYHFYIEQRGPDGWSLPADYKGESWLHHAYVGEFAWAHPRERWLALFFWERALFPMKAGPPDDWRGSPFLENLSLHYDVRNDDLGLYWISYPELFIDCWDTDFVTLISSVPASFALIFGDGNQRFPESELLEAGLPQERIDKIRRGWLATEHVDNLFGRDRFIVAQMPSDRQVDVTWRATISEFVGEPYANAFKSLRRYGPDDSLRILASALTTPSSPRR